MAGFSEHSCVAHRAGLEVHHCTAVQLIVKKKGGGEGGERERERKEGRNGGGEAVGPALPALGPALAGKLQLLLAEEEEEGGEGGVSSARLPLASP